MLNLLKMTAMELIEVLNWLLGLLTVIAGGGWFINWKANKRKSDAEATHEEADGWKAMQDLYQHTIEDFKVYSEDMRTERTILKKENSEMREKFKGYDEEIIELKRQLARQGRKIEAITPFLCSVVGCLNRKKVTLTDNIDDDSFTTVEERESLNNGMEIGV